MTLYPLELPSRRRRTRGPSRTASRGIDPGGGLDARRVGRWLLFPALALALIAAVVLEARTFRGQAWFFSKVASKLDTTLGAGPAPAIELRQPGPYDERLGYARLPREVERLRQDGWRVVAQARLAPLAMPWATL